MVSWKCCNDGLVSDNPFPPRFGDFCGDAIKEGEKLAEMRVPAVMGHLGLAISSSPEEVAHESFIKHLPWDSS